MGLVRRAARALVGERIAVLHAHRYKENLLAWLLAKRLGVRHLVTTMHGLPEAPQNRGEAVQAVGWMRRLDLAVVARLFSLTVAVSDDMKRTLVNRYRFRSERVRVIRNGGRFPVPMPAATRGDGIHVGTVSRLVPIKGLDLFLEVAGAVRSQAPSVRFSILGDGPLREELGRQAARLGIADCVEFLPPRPDPFDYYRSLDLYLNTSVHEGLPLSVVEAMASGTPVVSAAVGGIPEIVVDGEHGFLVNCRDAGQFAERCLTLVRDNRLRRSMGEDAAAAAHASLSADAMARQYRRLYEECSMRVTR
jgi:glycosyltransferase involved in cell wall biosynthesis